MEHSAHNPGSESSLVTPPASLDSTRSGGAPPDPPILHMPLERPGDEIGQYKLLEVIGKGGFGVVWLAERRDPYLQRVALKVIKPGMDTQEVMARFRQEQQALAMMNHRGVAKVLDGGVSPAGRPYFVMEYVQGEPITTFCDRYRLATSARIELFIQVCEAVHHAHANGIIHRDLKPANVLVAHATGGAPASGDESLGGSSGSRGGYAAAKVIDFGIAKAMNRGLSDETVYTHRGDLIGTPEYMSPEQAEMGALDVDHRVDVYSLGVLLYELLGGLLPLRRDELRRKTPVEIREIILAFSPPTPSGRLSSADRDAAAGIAQARSTTVENLCAELRRELEWIPLKAMRKNREERYATPLELANDLRRYLNGEAIRARPQSRLYLFHKAVERNRGFWSIALTLIGLGLLAVSQQIYEHYKPTTPQWSLMRLQLLIPLMVITASVFVSVTEYICLIGGSFHRRFGAALGAWVLAVLTIYMCMIPQHRPVVWSWVPDLTAAQIAAHQVVLLLVCVPVIRAIVRVSWARAATAYLVTGAIVTVILAATLLSGTEAAKMVNKAWLGIPATVNGQEPSHRE